MEDEVEQTGFSVANPTSSLRRYPSSFKYHLVTKVSVNPFGENLSAAFAM
jgi:hypothetical protein